MLKWPKVQAVGSADDRQGYRRRRSPNRRSRSCRAIQREVSTIGSRPRIASHQDILNVDIRHDGILFRSDSVWIVYAATIAPGIVVISIPVKSKVGSDRRGRSVVQPAPARVSATIDDDVSLHRRP